MADPIQGKCDGGMVHIPDSRFMMGSDGVMRPGDEKPRHEVRVTDYYIDKHEVSNRDYNAHLAQQKGEGKYKLVATSCDSLTQSVVAKGDDAKKLFEENRSKSGQCGLQVELNDQKKLENPSPVGFDGPDQPVVRVTWGEADAYCKAQGKRLPSEAEWEKAAIGPTKGYDTKIIFGTKSGDELKPEEAVYNTDRTADVCSKPANGNGLYDMTGNAWEWVNDWYSETYYANSPDTNPQGPAETGIRVLRGGGVWFLNNYPDFLRAANRGSDTSDDRGYNVGIRCASSQDPSKL